MKGDWSRHIPQRKKREEFGGSEKTLEEKKETLEGHKGMGEDKPEQHVVRGTESGFLTSNYEILGQGLQ